MVEQASARTRAQECLFAMVATVEVATIATLFNVARLEQLSILRLAHH